MCFLCPTLPQKSVSEADGTETFFAVVASSWHKHLQWQLLLGSPPCLICGCFPSSPSSYCYTMRFRGLIPAAKPWAGDSCQVQSISCSVRLGRGQHPEPWESHPCFILMTSWPARLGRGQLQVCWLWWPWWEQCSRSASSPLPPRVRASHVTLQNLEVPL